MATRMDTYIPDYALNVQVVNGTPWYGAIVPLYNAAGFTVFASLSGGAAGNLVAAPTNAVGNTALYTVNGGTYPAVAQTQSQTMTANSVQSLNFVSTTAGTYYQSFYVYFTTTASGVLNICVNVRRFGA